MATKSIGSAGVAVETGSIGVGGTVGGGFVGGTVGGGFVGGTVGGGFVGGTVGGGTRIVNEKLAMLMGSPPPTALQDWQAVN
jgi:hypothetical protein